MEVTPKQELEQSILGFIELFEKKTGVEVFYIEIKRINISDIESIGFRSTPNDIRFELR